MQLTIQAEQYNQQQGQQSKWYGQQYNQDKPGGGYIVSSTYAKARDPSKAWCLGGWCRKINSGAISDSIY